jgi:hypothetical protein
MSKTDLYILGAFITGLLSFCVIWLYALTEWGILLGLAIGWIPALIGGFILAIFWPLLVILLVLSWH